MKKLKLNLDEIKVESFETVLNQNKKGTAFGQGVSQDTDPTTPCDCGSGGGTANTNCGQNTCANTCDASCNGTCYNTCGPETCDLSPSCNFTAACSPCA